MYFDRFVGDKGKVYND